VSRTQVVHVNKAPFDVYIGRAYRDQPASLFQNPFKIGPDGSRQQVIEKYRQYAKDSPVIQQALEALRGKTLGCWCKPDACHGDVLVEMLEGKIEPPSQLNLLRL
jgi:hypothetical protein